MHSFNRKNTLWGHAHVFQECLEGLVYLLRSADFKLEMASRGKLKADFYRVEFHNTTWEVPKRYKELRAIGIGAFGSVW